MSQEKYTPEYVKFIKNFIANNCYVKYCLVVAEIENEESYKRNIMDYKNNEEIWKKVMNKLHIPMKYLTFLYKITKYGIPIHNINVFEHKTFQEFIDNTINIKTVGSHEYQRFIQSMQNETFKKKMFEKYNEFVFMNIIKNYIIYIIQLYLSRNNNSSTLFTDDEYDEMDISIDIVPYIEYLSKKNLGIDNFKYDNEYDYNIEYNSENIEETNYIKQNSIEEEYSDNLELETIKYINNAL